ncbi:uncharacterized protein LOC106061408 isoform X2 [Biomphalaria glabrata]|uniref:Uncharacterized protein LOC106061408 isoform X2 n=1 Tax=Biomphalaria glabrata TaxID=6526 RepID=A0A9W2YSM0_BIOGL|nr:uncharacterized protein LOC106061408 isoform X2 [Biomphalaria glabrata]
MKSYKNKCPVRLQSVLTIFSLIITQGGGVHGQDIVIKPYKQSESKTKCHYGLISGIDTIVMKASVTYWNSNHEYALNVQMFITKDNNTLKHYSVDLKKHCNKGNNLNEGCFCESLQKEVYTVTCRIYATTELSEAELHGVLYTYTKSKIRSNVEKLPKVYDISKIRITVNDEYIQNKNSCSFLMDSQKPSIFFCCDDAPWPCETFIYSKGIRMAQKNHCVTYTSNETPESKYTLGYKVCNIEKTSESFICYVSNAYSKRFCSAQLILILALSIVFPGMYL